MIATKLKNLVLILLAGLMLTSCQGHKQGGGAVIGALAGGLLGSRFGGGEGAILTTAVGAIAGGLIGSSIGKSLDEHDQMMAEKTTHNSLESAPSGKTAEWHNPDSGHSGSVTPTRTYQNKEGTYCREYTQTINVGGESKKAYGKACRKPDGHWEIVN
jgi:surface antigen